MKRFSYLLLAATLFTAIITGCGAASGGDPKTTLLTFSEKLGKKDFEGAKQLATRESAVVIDALKKMMEMAEKFAAMAPAGQPAPDNAFANPSIGDARIEGDIAYVPFTSGKETVEFPLKKQDGSWKVDFTEATMGKMGMSAGDLKDMEDGMKKLDNMNMDSLTKGMEEMKKMVKPENLQDLQEKAKELEKMGDDMKQRLEKMNQ